MADSITRVPGDGSEVSRVQTGPRVNPLLEAGRRNRFYLQTGTRSVGGSQLGAVDILGNVEILGSAGLGNVEIYPNPDPGSSMISTYGQRVSILGSPEAHIIGGRAMIPMTDPIMREMPRPMFRPLVRLMGESTIQQRRWGNRSLWEGTPLSGQTRANLGEPFDTTYDIGELLAGVEALGWEWDFKADLLKMHVRTSRGMTTVTIPGAKVRQIFMKAYQVAYGVMAPRRFRKKATCGDLFGDIGNFFTKEIPKAVNNVTAGIDSFVKNPGKWIEGATRDIGRVAEDVVSHVVSSEVFAGIMGTIAVIPPLQAVGGAGLAAYGIAKTAKTVIDASKAVVSTVQGVVESNKSKAPAAKSLVSQNALILEKALGKDKPPRALTQAEIQKIMASKEWKAWTQSKEFSNLNALSAKFPKIWPKGVTPPPKPVEVAVIVKLAQLAKKFGYFKKAPNVAESRTVATVGPKNIPIKVSSKPAPAPPQKKVAPKQEAKIVDAVEQLRANLTRLSQEKTPYARLLISGMQSVAV